MDESSARRALLARAIELADAQGRLLTPAERDQVDLQARQDALRHAGGREPMPAAAFVDLRAQRVLAHVAPHHPQLAALQEPRPWQGAIEWLVPIVALVTGVATDAIGNPHRVNLVALPLLGIVAWNLVMYLLLLGALFWRGPRTPWLAQLSRWRDGGWASRLRPSNAALQAAAQFHGDWFGATRPLFAARIQRVLHLSAAAWAAGIILSLLVRGLVVEYRVGWESTFLGPEQVFQILRALRWPALLVYPFDAFTVEDVARMRFGNFGGAQFGAPWVWMYVALLLTLVIGPRIVLAGIAAWRERRLASRVSVDLQEPYFARVVSLLESTRVQVGLVAHRDEDRERLLRVLAPERDALPILVASPVGDVLRLVDVPLVAPPEAAREAPRGWIDRVRSAFSPAEPASAQVQPLLDAREACDLVIHLRRDVQDDAAANALLSWLGKPVVTVQTGEGEGLRLASFASNWSLDRVLLDAMAAALPAPRRLGFQQVVRAWGARNDERLHRAMAAIAEHVLFAARQVEEVQAGSLSVKSLMPGEREAQAGARQAAMQRVLQRIEANALAMATRLRRVHGVDDAAATAIDHGLEERFVVQQPVDAPQAGVAGAATGAAMGASVDLLAGGLTLGAAAALGALVGGGAGYIAAAWKNRSSPSGATIVQLSDDMLEALTEAALLRYVAIVHWARGFPDADVRWRAEVAARVEAQRALMVGYWNTARTQPNAERLVAPLARELEAAARAVLKHMSS